MLSLVVREGRHPGTTFRLGRRGVTLGRDQRNLVQIVDPQVSRRHASILWTGDEYLLADLRSANGLYLNGERFTSGPIQVGDYVRLGTTVLEAVTYSEAHRDATQGTRVDDTQVVSSTTIAMDGMDGVQTLEPGQSVNVDEVLEQREFQLIRTSAHVRSALGRDADTEPTFQKAFDTLAELLGPDRILLFRLRGDEDPEQVSSRFAGWLADDRRDVAPAAQLIEQTRRSQAAAMDSALAADGDPGAVGSAAVVPIRAKSGDMVGLLYVDSLQENHQTYLDDDLRALQVLADALAGGL